MSKIGIDYTPAYEQGGGIGRYVRELTHALLATPTIPKHEYNLFVAGYDSSKPLPEIAHKSVAMLRWTPTPLSNKWLARIWHRANLPIPIEVFTGKLDLFHATDFVLPPTNRSTRTLLTVHDLSFIHTPETASPKLQQYLTKVVPRSVERADHILADSAATKQDLMDLYGTPPDKIEVLLSGVNRRFQPVTDSQALTDVRKKYDIGQQPYIFSIGTVQPRKNYTRLIEAAAMLRAGGEDVLVVIAGGKGWLEDGIYRAIERYHMKEHVKLIGFAADEDLPALYSGARCLFFVSLYEGFGLPVLEAMSCGTPVLTSNVSSLPEVAGEAALLVSPKDTGAIIEALQILVSDESKREQLIGRGYKQAARFSWDQAAEQLLSTYNRLLTTI